MIKERSAMLMGIESAASGMIARGDYAAAAKYYEKLFRLCPTDHRHAQALAVCYARTGLAPDSMKYFEVANILSPNNVEYLIQYASMSQLLGWDDVALAVFSRVLTVAPSADIAARVCNIIIDRAVKLYDLDGDYLHAAVADVIGLMDRYKMPADSRKKLVRAIGLIIPGIPGIHEKTLDLGRRIQEITNRKVPYGPFAGMMMPAASEDMDICVATAEIGSVESQLHNIIFKLRNRNFDKIMVVGAAHGYYAIGLALMFPGVSVIAWEAEEDRREACAEAAKENGVHNRLDLRGFADEPGLYSAIKDAGNPLVFMDVEGFELSLLSARVIESLRYGELIVECHDFIGENVSGIIAERLAETHEVVLINQEFPDPADYELLSQFDLLDRWVAVTELRPGNMRWIYAKGRG